MVSRVLFSNNTEKCQRLASLITVVVILIDRPGVAEVSSLTPFQYLYTFESLENVQNALAHHLKVKYFSPPRFDPQPKVMGKKAMSYVGWFYFLR